MVMIVKNHLLSYQGESALQDPSFARTITFQAVLKGGTKYGTCRRLWRRGAERSKKERKGAGYEKQEGISNGRGEKGDGLKLSLERNQVVLLVGRASMSKIPSRLNCPLTLL